MIKGNNYGIIIHYYSLNNRHVSDSLNDKTAVSINYVWTNRDMCEESYRIAVEFYKYSHGLEKGINTVADRPDWMDELNGKPGFKIIDNSGNEIDRTNEIILRSTNNMYGVFAVSMNSVCDKYIIGDIIKVERV